MTTPTFAQGRNDLAVEAPDAPPAGAVVKIAVEDGWVADWAIDDATGRVFASIGSEEVPGEAKAAAGRVVEFDPVGGTVLREFPVGPKPRQILIKNGKLVVGVEAAVSLYIIDLKTNKVDGRIQLAGKGPYGMFCSRAGNPWVYAISNTGSAWWDGEIFQVDVVTRKVRKQVRVQGWSQSHPVHVAMTPDGRYIVPDARGASSPSGADLMRVDEDALTFSNLRRHHDSFGHIVAAPNGRFWTLGGMLYPLDLKGKVRQFEGSTIAVHPTLDLVAGFGGSVHDGGDKARRLTLQTFSTAAPVAQLLLDVSTSDRAEDRPAAANRKNQPRRAKPENLWRDDPTVQFDAPNDRLFVGFAQNATVIDLKRMKVNAKPLLLLTVPDGVEVGTSKALRIPLTLSDPAMSGDTTFTLDEAPEGMKIEKREIVWTPKESDVGRATVVIKAVRDDASDSAKIDIDVTRPSFDFGAPVSQFVVNSAGDRALAVLAVQPPPGQGQQQGRIDENALGYDLVLFDVKAGKELARRRFQEMFSAIAFDTKGVYVATRGVSRFSVLKPTDLSDDRRVFTDQEITALDIVPGPEGAGVAVATGGGIRIFDGKSLGPQLLTNFVFMGSRNAATLTRPLAGGIVAFDSFAFDPKTGERKMLLANPGFLIANPEAQRFSAEIGFPNPWNRIVQGNQISGPSNTRIASTGDGTTILLPMAPLAVTASRKTEQGPDNRSVESLRLEFRNLVDGAQLDPLTLVERPIDPNQQQRFRRSSAFGDRPHLLSRGDRLLVVSDGRFFDVTVPKDRLANLPMPVSFNAELLPLTSPVKGTLTLNPKAAGGKGKLTYQLADDPEGVEIDAVTGAVRIDTRAVWDRFLKQAPSGGVPAGQDPLQNAQATYKRIFGTATTDFPIAMNVRVAATDEENQRAELSAWVVLLGPAQEGTAAFASRNHPATQPAAFAQPVPATQPVQAQAGSTADVKALERKIDNLTNLVLELNRRVQDLEAKQRQEALHKPERDPD